MRPFCLSRLIYAMIFIGLTAAVAACGKASAPFPPEDQEGKFTYPSIYPPPESVTPNYRVPKFDVPEQEDEPSLSPSPYDRTTTRVYDSE